MSTNGQDGEMENFKVEQSSENMHDKRKVNRRKKMKSILKEVSASSSFSGVSHIASARSKLGIIFWSLILLAGLFGFTMNLHGLVVRLMRGPVIETYIPEGGDFVWPDITLCNTMNPLPFWASSSKLQIIWKSLQRKAVVYAREIYKHFPSLRLNDVLAMCSINPKGIFDNVGNMVFDASLNSFYSDESKVGMYDSSDKFDRFKNQYYARLIPNRFPTPCMTFNIAGFTNSQALVNKSKTVHEIKFFVMMVLDSYNKFNSYYENRRLSIYINQPGHTVSLRDRHFGLPGSDVFMEISMTRIQRLTNRNKCVADPFKVEEYNSLLTTTREQVGSHRDCEMFVTQRETVKRCGCYTTKYPLYKVNSNRTYPRLCLNMTTYSSKEVVDNLKCMNDVEDGPKLQKSIEEKCDRFKLKPCNEIQYRINHDSIPWSTDVNKARQQYLDALALGGIMPLLRRRTPLKNYLRKNMLFLNVRKSTRRPDTLQEEYSYSFPQFVSDVGGIIGLWLGFNIISLFELLEMLCISCRYCAGH